MVKPNRRHAGRPADAHNRVASWQAGDTIPLGRRTLRVVEVREGNLQQPTVLVVEDMSE